MCPSPVYPPSGPKRLTLHPSSQDRLLLHSLRYAGWYGGRGSMGSILHCDVYIIIFGSDTLLRQSYKVESQTGVVHNDADFYKRTITFTSSWFILLSSSWIDPETAPPPCPSTTISVGSSPSISANSCSRSLEKACTKRNPPQLYHGRCSRSTVAAGRSHNSMEFSG
jgi:hypothetical protein